MPAKKTAAKAAVSTVRNDDAASVPSGSVLEGVPYLDPELEKARDEARKNEPDTKVAAPEEPTIDDELVKAREAALKAEKK